MVILFIPLTFMIFAIDNINDFREYFYRLINIGITYGNPQDILNFIKDYGKIFLISIIFITKLPRIIYNKIKNNNKIMLPLSIILILFSIYLIYIGLNDPFLYFRF